MTDVYVSQALGRLSPQETYDRAYRIRVAVNQSMLHTELPKDQWVKPSEVCHFDSKAQARKS